MINKTYNWKTAGLTWETGDALTIVFENGGDRFLFKPGQFVNVKQVINGEAISRSYSLSSTPFEGKPSITVKKVEGGTMSNHIFRCAETINQWEVEGPFGSFSADPEESARRTIV